MNAIAISRILAAKHAFEVPIRFVLFSVNSVDLQVLDLPLMATDQDTLRRQYKQLALLVIYPAACFLTHSHCCDLTEH